MFYGGKGGLIYKSYTCLIYLFFSLLSRRILAFTYSWFLAIARKVTKLSSLLSLSSSSKLTIALENLWLLFIGISSYSFPVIHGCIRAYSTLYLDPGFKLHNYSIKFLASTGISTL